MSHGRRYFRRLQRRYSQDPSPAVTAADYVNSSASQRNGGGSTAGRGFPVACINLLRLNEQRRNEHLLTEKFDEVILHSFSCPTIACHLGISSRTVVLPFQSMLHM